ncbi:MAG: hypothetical protein AB7K09_09950 [Planctomycetota bacterium]
MSTHDPDDYYQDTAPDGDDLPEPGEMRPLWLEQERPPQPPDHLGMAVRFGCGGFFGVFLALCLTWNPLWIALIVVVCGLGAAVMGDNFFKISYIIWPFGWSRRR